jgi:hypothetical protein
MFQKKIILITGLSILLALSSIAQTQVIEPTENLSGIVNHSKDQYLTDSTYFYNGIETGTQWYHNKIYRVQERNAANNVVLAYDYDFSSKDRAWFQQRKYQGSFLNDTIRTLWQSWVKNTNTNEWLLADSIHFNINGAPTISWYKVWDPFMNKFVDGKFSDFIYNDEGLLHLAYNHYWDTAANSWQRSSYEVNFYNQNGLDSINQFFFWNGINWIKDRQTHFTYTPKLLPEEEIQEIWNGVDWENSRKIVYSYSNDLIADILVFNWQPGLQEWFNYGLTEYTYNPDETLHQVSNYLWNGSDWLNSTRKTYAYNSNQETLEILNELWTFSTETWENLSLNVYSYDNASGNREEFSFYTWNTETEQWSNFYRERNFWGFYPSPSVPEIPKAGFSIFPNPSRGVFSIEFENMQKAVHDGFLMIYSIDGRLVKTIQAGNLQSSINAEDLPTGVYRLVLKMNEGISNHTLIISR